MAWNSISICSDFRARLPHEHISSLVRDSDFDREPLPASGIADPFEDGDMRPAACLRIREKKLKTLAPFVSFRFLNTAEQLCRASGRPRRREHCAADYFPISNGY